MLRHARILVVCIGVANTALAEPVAYSFANVGMSYSAALFQDSPLVGLEITGARIVMEVEIDPGSEAANFVADLAMPIDPLIGNTSVIVLTGDALGWQGDGTFRYSDETDEFNGFLTARRYGAATYGDGFTGQILEGYVELDVPDFIRGDFNANIMLDVEDIDLLTERVRSGEYSQWYDLNFDNVVDETDRVIWVEEKKGTYFGDANLDGEFNSNDFVAIFQAAEYDDGVKKNSTWATGDWNGDQDFNSGDFILAFQSGGFEVGPRSMPALVPEPLSTYWQPAVAFLLFALLRRRSRDTDS